MTDALTKAAQAALDALDNAIDHLPKPYSTGCSNAATDLRAALAAQQAPDLIPQDALFSCPQMGNSVTRVTQQAAQPVARPDGRLHADGYFTWTRRDGYVLDAKLPCDFYLAAQPQQDADELGWLIEMQFGDGLLWWSGCFDDDGTYPPSRLIARMVNDVNKAVRFSRREDAQRVLDAMLAAQPCPLLARAKTLYSVHEHMWPEAAQPQQAEPSRSQKMRDAGFTPRDTRLECDECGQKVTAQFMPIHKCAQQAAQPVSCQAPLDTSQAAQSVALPDLPTHWTKVTDPDGVEVKVWRAFQMRDFARAAIAAAQPQQATDKIGGAA